MKSKEKEKQEKKEVIDKINKQSKEDAKKEDTKKEEKKPEAKTTTHQDKEKEKNNKDNSSSNKIETSNPLNMKKEELKGPVENKPTSISTYNGDKCKDYNWSQGVGWCHNSIRFETKNK